MPATPDPVAPRPANWALPPAAAADPAFGRLHAYWLGKTRGDRLPARGDVHPTEIAADLLPQIGLLGVEDHGGRRRYRIRLFGSGLESMTGGDETGHFYDEAVEPGPYAEIARRLDAVVAERRPDYYAAPSGAAGRGFLLFGRLALPLAGDGMRVDMILGLVRPLKP